jgi:hypothetical protein
MFRLFRRSSSQSQNAWFRGFDDQGIWLSPHAQAGGHRLVCEDASGLVSQLLDEGFATEAEDSVRLTWDAVYEVLSHPAYSDAAALLELSGWTALRPTLVSRGALSDDNFSIALSDWYKPDGRRANARLEGALIHSDDGARLLTPEQWRLVTQVRAFAARSDEQRNDLYHRQAWGRLRKLALAAGARLDDFLHRSVVITPEKLAIGIRKAEIDNDKVIELEPGFEGAPTDWLSYFDRSREVRERYDIATPDGIVQVLVSPQVRTVLQEIKKLPGRRIAGARAQAFILNPFAALGEDAKDVIEESQFEEAREAAGLFYERFLPQVDRDVQGFPRRVGLLIESARADGPTTSELIWLNDDQLAHFVGQLSHALDRNYQLLGWEGYDFELQGNAPEHLRLLQAALDERQKRPVLISYSDIHDLSIYSSRIEGIGFEKAYYSPYIAKKKDDEGWFPDNIIPVITCPSEDEAEIVAIPVSESARADLQRQIDGAKASGRDAFELPGLPKPISVKEAEAILQTFNNVFEDAAKGDFDPEKLRQHDRASPTQRKSLVIRANIQGVDYEEGDNYEEVRRAALRAIPTEPEIPGSLRPDMALLPHQRTGVAWMQHLFKLRDTHNCCGAILADDMGLGKTFQLLTLMAWAIEQQSDIDPMLVVAPVSLLENWREEAEKFFVEGSLPILTAYGEGLKDLRVPRDAIDKRLRDEDGLVNFLKPNWLGNAKVVLTTYETLRDLEFSFAAQRWSIMVCDEAQKIKNPAAMVTRAAKKQNVRFKIACTGTPVENTLADLWCLFDFIQPGLLGALNDFGRRYRKPIEAKTEEEIARVEELRSRIAPQILRRTKVEVAENLPKKIVSESCRRLPLSSAQRNLYAQAIELFRNRHQSGVSSPFKNYLGLLHYLRLICTDPRRIGLDVFKPESLKDYRVQAPKLHWLINQLQEIKARGDGGEKVIIFCEFRNIQRLLQHYIKEVFGFAPDIINGDTSASASHTASRQKRIKAFQAKPGFGVIILSPVAVGFGVNIQAANHVIHYTRTWNPAKEDQATDRAYRIGQTKDVHVYYPIVHADDFTTFDVKLDALLESKRALASDMLNGSGDIKPGDFDIADVVPEAAKTMADERVTLEYVLRMEWDYFESLVCVLWTRQGYQAFRTPQKDNGIDVVALNGDSGYLIQSKTCGNDGAQLGWDAVKDVVTGAAFYQRQFPGVHFEKCCVTNQYFNTQARENAQLNGVELIDQPRLTELLQKFQVTMLDVERVLRPDWETA